MATQLMKLKVSVDTDTVTTPTDTRFFYVTTTITAAGATLTIDAADFLDDNGDPVVTLPTLTTDDSYFSVYLNGALQMESICTYTPGATGVGKLEIAVPAGGTSILADTPVGLEVMNYAPVSTNTILT
ncbi:MAG: DUF4183 domain-containing protein [Bacilli bacterium]|nr:DUF4183 domain-containing protein [Bacilli bacterium]